MAPREPTRAQLSSKLAYHAHTPNFLLKFKNHMNGVPDDDDDDDKEDNLNDDQFEHVGGGREPIPRRPRPPIPERPRDDPGSEGEDGDDEKPQVVVLKTGKHLSEREAENIRRAEKGLPPLPETTDTTSAVAEKSSDAKTSESSSKTKADAASHSKGLSFSSSNFKSNKRKAVDLDELKFPDDEKGPGKKKEGKASKNPAKKSKKEKKSLLSFADDA